MPQTHQVNVTLPQQMAKFVHDKVASGEYADEGEVIREGLQSLVTRDRAIEDWLTQEVGPALDELEHHPERAVPASAVREALAAEYARWTQIK